MPNKAYISAESDAVVASKFDGVIVAQMSKYKCDSAYKFETKILVFKL